jgi:hypothetical protein
MQFRVFIIPIVSHGLKSTKTNSAERVNPSEKPTNILVPFRKSFPREFDFKNGTNGNVTVST